jgi:hypothetical protein
MMKKLLIAALLAGSFSVAYAAGESITVYKDKNCGCCGAWVDYMREAGFKVKAVNLEDMAGVKKRLGIPDSMGSCHTAVLDKSGQLIEGHVPVAAVQKLIARPTVRGVAVPGMPANSPGMGKMDGTLITYDLAGKSFSRD